MAHHGLAPITGHTASWSRSLDLEDAAGWSDSPVFVPNTRGTPLSRGGPDAAAHSSSLSGVAVAAGLSHPAGTHRRSGSSVAVPPYEHTVGDAGTASPVTTSRASSAHVAALCGDTRATCAVCSHPAQRGNRFKVCQLPCCPQTPSRSFFFPPQ
jgi:hypothetical protein